MKSGSVSAYLYRIKEPALQLYEDEEMGAVLQEYIHLEDGVVALNVKEQRLSNFIQGVLVAACLGASPAVKRIPKSVLWGYFAYMSLEGLPGSEFWDRILLSFTDKRRRFELRPISVSACHIDD